MSSVASTANVRRRKLHQSGEEELQKTTSPHDLQQFDLDNRELIKEDSDFWKNAQNARQREFDNRWKSGTARAGHSSPREDIADYITNLQNVADLAREEYIAKQSGQTNKGTTSGLEAEDKLREIGIDSSPNESDNRHPSFLEFVETIAAWGGYMMRDDKTKRGDAVRSFYMYRAHPPLNPRLRRRHNADKTGYQLSNKVVMSGPIEGSRFLNPNDPGIHLWFESRIRKLLYWFGVGWLIGILMVAVFKKRIKHSVARKRNTRRWFQQQAALASRSEFLWSMWNEFAVRGFTHTEDSPWKKRFMGLFMQDKNIWVKKTLRYARLLGFWFYIPSFADWFLPLPYYQMEPRLLGLAFLRVIPRWIFKLYAHPEWFGIPPLSRFVDWMHALPRYQEWNNRLRRTSGPLYIWKAMFIYDTVFVIIPKVWWGRNYHYPQSKSNVVDPYLKSMNYKPGPENTFMPGRHTPNSWTNFAKSTFRKVFPIPVLPHKKATWWDSFRSLLTPFPRYRAKKAAMQYEKYENQDKEMQKFAGRVPVVNRSW